MICPKCRSEYQPGFTECAFCHVPLIDAADLQPDPEVELVPLSFPQSLDPVFAESLLSSEGIECIVEGDGLRDIAASGSVLGAAGVLVNPTRVLVRREDAERANALLADMDAGVVELDDDELSVPEESAPALDRRMGEGEFPPELDRVNWGAVLWGPIWALFHGIWSWVFMLSAVLFIVPVLFSVVMVLGRLNDELSGLAALFLYSALYWCAVALFGLQANRLVWEHESRITLARAGQPLPHSSPQLTRFVEVEGRWKAWGITLTGLAWGLSYLRVAKYAEPLADQIVGSVVPLGVLGVLFVYDMRRRTVLGADGRPEGISPR